ncbi:MAG: MFS transporter [Alphaproteobacteria bacterium]|nr:MFS transporter [Alphaproteobacteria bacterium]
MAESSAALAPSTPWYREVSPAAWKVLRFAGVAWTFDVFDSFLLSLTIPALIATFKLSNSEAGAIGSILAAGLIVGGIVMGYVADRIGRVRALVISVLVYSVFSSATALAPSGSWVAVLRFCAGLGMGGGWTSGAALVAETWDPRHRGKGGALMQMGLPVGSMLAIGIAALVTELAGGLEGNGWRILYALCLIPGLILLVLARFTPESPIWRRRAQEPAPRGQISDLFRPENRHGLLLAFGFIFFAQYIYWGVFTWTPTFLVSVKHLAFIRSLGFTMSQQIGSLLGFLVFAALVDRLGRRPTFLIYLAIGAIAVSVFVLVSSQLVLMVTVFFTGFGITGIFAGLGPLTAELVPNTAARGLSMGVAYNGGRLGGLIAPYLIGALASSASGFMIGMATTILAFVLAAIVIALAPETRGTELA